MTRDCGLLSGAAAWRVIPETIFFTTIASVITFLSERMNLHLGISNQILTVMGAVLGLVVTFRTSSAYDRYWEARKLWATINMQSRNLARLIYVHIPSDRVDKNAENQSNGVKPNVPSWTIASEKHSAMSLVEAYSVAVKHALRGERGLHYEDLLPLVANALDASTTPLSHEHTKKLSHHWSPSSITLVSTEPPERAVVRDRPLPSRSTTVSSFPILNSSDAPKTTSSYFPINKLRRSASLESQRPMHTTLQFPDSTITDNSKLPILSPAQQGPHRCHLREWIPFAFRAVFHLASQLINLVRNVRKKRGLEHTSASEKLSPRCAIGSSEELNVPLQITIYLSDYVQWLLRNDLIKPAVALGFTNGIVALEDTALQLDRIKSTPIPSAYQDHLRLSLWLYLFFFPFQVLETLGYFTILATALYAYVLLGFMEIGRDIENPFTYLMNNLDLDQFCSIIRRDLRQVSSHYSLDAQLDVYAQHSSGTSHHYT